MKSTDQIEVLLTDSTISHRLGVVDAIEANPALSDVQISVATEGMVGNRSELDPFLEKIDILVTAYSAITDDLLSSAPRLKLIVKAGIGTETIDIEAAERRGITVTCTPGGCR